MQIVFLTKSAELLKRAVSNAKIETASSVLFNLLYFRAKREKRKLYKLKALNTLWDTDYRNAVDNTDNEVNERKLPTADNSPNNVCNRMLCKVQVNLFSVGKERKTSHFETLNTKGNSNNCNAENKSQNTPKQSKPDAAKDSPNNICN